MGLCRGRAGLSQSGTSQVEGRGGLNQGRVPRVEEWRGVGFLGSEDLCSICTQWQDLGQNACGEVGGEQEVHVLQSCEGFLGLPPWFGGREPGAAEPWS